MFCFRYRHRRFYFCQFLFQHYFLRYFSTWDFTWYLQHCCIYLFIFVVVHKVVRSEYSLVAIYNPTKLIMKLNQSLKELKATRKRTWWFM